MAWSWSHTNEAYADAELNLSELSPVTLREIWAEWLATEFSPARYESALVAVASMDADTLADCIWDRASDHAVCDNGGFNAWMCPHGCGPHCVPFDREHIA